MSCVNEGPKYNLKQRRKTNQNKARFYCIYLTADMLPCWRGGANTLTAPGCRVNRFDVYMTSFNSSPLYHSPCSCYQPCYTGFWFGFFPVCLRQGLEVQVSASLAPYKLCLQACTVKHSLGYTVLKVLQA